MVDALLQLHRNKHYSVRVTWKRSGWLSPTVVKCHHFLRRISMYLVLLRQQQSFLVPQCPDLPLQLDGLLCLVGRLLGCSLGANNKFGLL